MTFTDERKPLRIGALNNVDIYEALLQFPGSLMVNENDYLVPNKNEKAG